MTTAPGMHEAMNQAAIEADGAAWQRVRRDALALLRRAADQAEEWERVLLRDHVRMVAPLFAMHVREMEASAATAAGIGARASALLGGAWGAKRREMAKPVGALLTSVLVGAALGAAGGFVAGRTYERAYGPLRPRVPATLPLWAEDRLRCIVIGHLADGASPADVAAWPVQGWRETWAELAAEYERTPLGAIMPPPGAPSLRELLRRVRQVRAPPHP